MTAFKRDPRKGYASSFYEFLLEVRDGQEFLQRIRPDSDKCGAAMRAAPIGIFATIPEVLQRARIQAAITPGPRTTSNSARKALESRTL